jgi:hypothetical protein
VNFSGRILKKRLTDREDQDDTAWEDVTPLRVTAIATILLSKVQQ